MRSKEDLNALKEKAEAMNLTDEELGQVTGGSDPVTTLESENSESIDWEQLIEG